MFGLGGVGGELVRGLGFTNHEGPGECGMSVCLRCRGVG